MCSWYTTLSSSVSIVDQSSNEETSEPSPTVFSLLYYCDSTHRCCTISTYICTLSLPCFDSVPDIDNGSIIAHHTDQPQARLAMLKQLELNSSILVFLQTARSMIKYPKQPKSEVRVILVFHTLTITCPIIEVGMRLKGYPALSLPLYVLPSICEPINSQPLNVSHVSTH